MTAMNPANRTNVEGVMQSSFVNFAELMKLPEYQWTFPLDQQGSMEALFSKLQESVGGKCRIVSTVETITLHL